MALPGQVVAYGRAVEILSQAYADYSFAGVSISLHSTAYVPNTSHAFDSDLRGEVSGGGYARRKLQGREITFDEATQRFQLRATRVVWPLVTLTARWAVIRFDQSSGPTLLAWVDLGASRQVFNSTFTIGWENDMIMEVEGLG